MTDSDTPTPRASGLWQHWRDHALTLEKRLREWAKLRASPHRLELLDLEGARRADSFAIEARELANAFDTWPRTPPEDSATWIQRLADLQRDAENHMAGIRRSER